MDTVQTSPTSTSADDLKSAFESAYQNFVTVLQEAGPPSDAQARAADAYRVYAELVEQFWASEPVRRRAQEAQEAYTQALRDAFSPEPVRARTRDAFREYVRVTRDAWLRIDPDHVDPMLMAGIAQALMSVAGLAASAAPERTW
jgi:hypothetical protein